MAKTIKFIIFIIFIIFPFGQLTKIPLGIPGVSLYCQDLVIGLLVFYWLIDHFWKKKPFLRPPLCRPILIFIVIALFSWGINLGRLESFGRLERMTSFLYLLRWSVYAGVYFIIYEITDNKEQKTKNRKRTANNRILKLLATTGVLVGILGLLQYLLYPNLRNLYYLGWDPHQYRVFGTFFDPGFTGIILVLTMILLLSSESSRCHPEPEGRRISWRFFAPLRMTNEGFRMTANLLLKTGSGILVFLALLLTYSRSSYLALTAGMFVLAWLKKSAKYLIFPFLILLFVIGNRFLPSPAGEGVKLARKSTVLARMENYGQTLRIIADQPIFGVGFNNLRLVKKEYGFLGEDWRTSHSGAGADASLLFVWATTGVVGLGAYLWLWWKITQNSKALPRPLPELSGRFSRFVPPSEESFSSVPLPESQSPLRESDFAFGHLGGGTSLGLSRRRNFAEIILPSVIALFVHSLFLNSLFYPWVMVWMWVLLGVAPRARTEVRYYNNKLKFVTPGLFQEKK